MEKPINQRIKILIENENLNTTSFSNVIGVRQSTIQSMFKRNCNPNMETFIKITNAFPLYNVLWLLYGVGNMHQLDNDQIKKEVDAEK